ncbi:hypothetical protein HN371_14625 [Candidatus Poribacteria bacterium]|jgi:hypothetical protein|nr:hypothetical protein [Candidatus Poribacteria bacterium]MBT5712224.1 hypothetical protein [Candidatus Poribacteria bacterium]MBT7099809.1 hypothetical protein [Candidatus Poribacteria bacterium]MBT7806968.1 hypothetical protein [Candidatus Poribacteria bacterium]
MPGSLLGLVAILGAFGTPIAITWLIVNAARHRIKGSSEEFAALRAEMEDLRQQMEANNADITLMLDDIRRTSLPGNPPS